MRRIDELHPEFPFAGARMGLTALHRELNTSRKAHGDNIHPCLLRTLPITRANQVWATDITYIPMAKGFIYLVAVIDWYSGKVLAWRLLITMDVGFCIEALEEAIIKYGTPDIFNTDQGSQGGFNRSSQHQVVERILDTHPRSQLVSSTPTFYAACYSKSGPPPESLARSGEPGQCLWGSIGAAAHSWSRWCHAAMGCEDQQRRRALRTRW